MLRHSVPHALPNFQNIVCGEAELNTVFCLPREMNDNSFFKVQVRKLKISCVPNVSHIQRKVENGVSLYMDSSAFSAIRGTQH